VLAVNRMSSSWLPPDARCGGDQLQPLHPVGR
jgi:hypothetical protein